MRLIALIQTVVPVAFGLGFVVFGIVMFARIGSSERQFEANLQSIRVGEVQPETLTLVRKYINRGKRGGWPHVVFHSNRQPEVNVSATRKFWDAVNPGDTILGYYFPDGYFIPQNYGGDAGVAKWVFLGSGVLLGAGILAYAFARGMTRPPDGDVQALRTSIRDRIERH
jgi:hypothetical protein